MLSTAKCSTIVVVGMVMFKIKELVKYSDKSEIWAEDVKEIRKTFDAQNKVGVNITSDVKKNRQNRSGGNSKSVYNTASKVYPAEDTVKKHYSHTTLQRDIHRTYAVANTAVTKK